MLPAVEWRRPAEFLGEGKPPKIFEGRIESSDIVLGQLGDCWLLCALASISTYEQLVKDLIPESECNPSMGLYVTKLCKDGEWKKVLLDSYFPCVPKSGPIYAKNGRGELWVSLLEKVSKQLAFPLILYSCVDCCYASFTCCSPPTRRPSRSTTGLTQQLGVAGFTRL